MLLHDYAISAISEGMDSPSIYMQLVLLALLAGSSIGFGAFLASYEHIRRQWLKEELQHTVTAIGAGALLAAVALVLIPRGMEKQPLWISLPAFLAGGFATMAVEVYLKKSKTAASQLFAMLLDFIPECIVVGALIGTNFNESVMLAIIIFAQNLPESFTSFREMQSNGEIGRKKMLMYFCLIAISGPIYALPGAALFAGQAAMLSVLMLSSAGGILYLVFNDIAPQVPLKNHWLPPMGALLGFVFGMVGHHLI